MQMLLIVTRETADLSEAREGKGLDEKIAVETGGAQRRLSARSWNSNGLGLIPREV